MAVLFKDIPGYEGKYSVDADGNVYSYWLDGFKKHTMRKGYPAVNLVAHDGSKKVWDVHKLVTLTFIGECPDNMEVLHLDNNPANCKLSNLKYGTHYENMRQQYKDGTRVMGATHGRAKLTEEEVLKIRELGKTMSHQKVADSVGMSRRHIGDIINGKNWCHI